MRRRESPPHGVIQMRRPQAPPLSPSLSLRGAAGPTASPISVSARGACRPSVRTATRVTSKRSGGSDRDSLEPVRERGLGRSRHPLSWADTLGLSVPPGFSSCCSGPLWVRRREGEGRQ